METKESGKLKDRKERFSLKSVISYKEIEDSLQVEGYIATTHFDGEDRLTKELLYKWADEINDGNPRANKVSVNHDRTPHVAGVGVKGSARVDELPDGEFGLFVTTNIDNTHEDFEGIKYRIENDFLDSFSIEYCSADEEVFDDSGARILGEDTELYGWALASQPMNEHAVMIKELFRQKEDITMTEKKEDVPAEEPKKEEAPVAEEAKVEETKPAEEPKAEEPEKVSEEETKELKAFREFKAKEKLEAKEAKMEEKIKSVVATELKEAKIEDKTQINKDVEVKELVEYKEMLKEESKFTPEAKFQAAAKVAEKAGLITEGGVKESNTFAEQRAAQGKMTFSCKNLGSKHTIEFKGLGITTNQNTDTDYLLSAAELADVFDPIIYNYLNQDVSTWNLLPKEDYSNKGNNQVQFTIKTTANTTAAAYTGNAVITGTVGRVKYMTKFKKYQVGVEVDGDMIAAARGGPIGDVFAKEVMDSTEDLLEVMDTALFAEVGAETAAGVIGFEYITDSAGNTTLYNVTRSAANQLAPTAAGNTYIDGASADISLSNLRSALRQARTEGAKKANLVFVTAYVQEDKFKQVYDATERHPAPTSTKFGFEGMMSFDGVPIFGSKNINSDDWFLVDLETHKIAIWVPPTLEMLGKDSDAQKGFIKAYWCTYNRAPRRMVQIYDNATS